MNACPHCDESNAILTSYAYNNGSAQWSNYRCDYCNCEWRLDRQARITIVVKGATPDEVKREVMRFAMIGHSMQEMQRRNAPDHWFIYA